MEMVDLVIRPKKYKDPITLHVFSDIHRSASGCDAKKLRSDINKLKHAVEQRGELHYWIGGGDWADCINPKDKRFDDVSEEFSQWTGTDLIGKECRTLASEFAPIRDYGLCIGTGNHEDKYSTNHSMDPARTIAQLLNLPYVGYAVVVRVTIRPQDTRHVAVVIFYWHHGYGGGRTRGGKIAKLERFNSVIKNADVIGCGHDHEIVEFPGAGMEVSRRGPMKLYASPTYYFNAGTYLRTYPARKDPIRRIQFDPDRIVRTNYAEKQGYKPTHIGHNGFRMRMTHSGGKRLGQQWAVNIEKVNF